MTDAQKVKTKNRDKFCQVCGSTRNLTVDHIIPLVEGGTDEDSNLTTLCKHCNLRKGPIPPFRQRVVNLFNGNFYWFKSEIRGEVASVKANFFQLKADLKVQLGSRFGDVRVRLDNQEITNGLLLGKIAKLQADLKLAEARDFVTSQRLAAMEAYHKILWVEGEGYIKLKRGKK